MEKMAPSKKTLSLSLWSMGMEISSPTPCFGCEEKGKELLEAVDNYSRDMLN